MTHIVPCEDPANDADDWFIERDGKQYPDDEILSEEEVHAASCDEDGNLLGSVEEIEAAIDAAEAEAIKAALVRRRHARDKCHTECYFRLQCLDLALRNPPPTHGIWGGYYGEELKQIRDVRDQKLRLRRGQSHDADVRSEE